MKVDYCFYELTADEALQARSHQTCRQGTLLKVSFENQKVGYADCHPWPELGDLSLLGQLNALKQGKLTPLMQCSLSLAYLDAQARENKEVLAHSNKIPLSHALIPTILGRSDKEIKEIETQGYSHLKIKVGRYPNQEADHLIKLFEKRKTLKLRLDCNETFSFASFRLFLDRIQALKSLIDFIEDPFPFHIQQWESFQKEGWSLACDRHVPLAIGWPNAAHVLVFKPAIQSEEQWKKVTSQRKVITSYLGHPLDQMAAAYVATQVDTEKKEIHGLLSHRVYPPNIFSRQLAWQGPRFTLITNGHGWGFEQELMQLNWKKGI